MRTLDGKVVVITGAAPLRRAHPATWTTFSEIVTETAEFWRQRDRVFRVLVA